MQAHDLHQHLVGVGGAVEGAGARAVIGAAIRFQQGVAADLALGIELADRAFSSFGRPEVIGPAGTKIAGRWPKAARRSAGRARSCRRRPGSARVEHVVAERDGGRHGDHVAAEQRQLHAGLALGDAVAHGRHAAGELRDAPTSRAQILISRENVRRADAPTACRCRR